MLSKSSKYAIKAVIYLAVNSSQEHKVLVRDMYQEVNVSETYLAKLMQMLARQKIISSSKGRGGGFYLTEDNMDKTLLDIVRAIDGLDGLTSCVLGINACDVTNPCVLHDLVGSSKSDFYRVLDRTSLNAVVKRVQQGKLNFPL